MKQVGFTIIEILIAVSILIIVSAILVRSAGSALENSRNNQRKADLRKVQEALQEYYADHGFYPCSEGIALWDPPCYQASGAIAIGFNNYPQSAGAHLTDCTGNPLSCNPSREYFYWNFEDPIWKDGPGPKPPGGDHYCYTSFDSATNKSICNNTNIKCEYYELAATMEVTPQNSGVTSFPYNGGAWSCNGGGNHPNYNYAISPLGNVTFTSNHFAP